MRTSQLSVALDIFAIVISSTLLLYAKSQPKLTRNVNGYFMMLCVSNLAMLTGDLSIWLCEGFARPWYPAVIRCGTLLLYLGGLFAPLIYTCYVKAFLTPRLAVHPGIIKAVVALTIFNGMFVLVNLFNGIFYYFDSQGLYIRGSYWWLSQLIPSCIAMVSVGTVWRYRRVMRPKEVLSFLSYMGLSLIALVVQGILYDPAILYPAVTVSILIIFLNIQSEQAFLFKQQELELDKTRIAIMLSQIQPHFLYNALVGIKALCDIDPQKASTSLEHFSHYLRGNLDSLSDARLVPFEKEICHIKDYLYLEKIRFEENLNIVWELNVTDFLLPSLTVQPIVENAIRHGITEKPDGGTLTIRSELTSGSIVITVIDDGVGFDTDNVREDERTHIGIENVRKRLAAQCGGALSIESHPNVGTTAKIILPEKGGTSETGDGNPGRPAGRDREGVWLYEDYGG